MSSCNCYSIDYSPLPPPPPSSSCYYSDGGGCYTTDCYLVVDCMVMMLLRLLSGCGSSSCSYYCCYSVSAHLFRSPDDYGDVDCGILGCMMNAFVVADLTVVVVCYYCY